MRSTALPPFAIARPAAPQAAPLATSDPATRRQWLRLGGAALAAGSGLLTAGCSSTGPVRPARSEVVPFSTSDRLGGLPAEQRQSIQLAFLGGRSHPEVAASLQRPLGSVKSWIRRGLAALKECIEACDAQATN